MLSLKGFLGLDGSGWEAGLKKAHAQTDHFVEHVESAQQKAAKIFGSGSLGGLVGGAVGGLLGSSAGNAVSEFFHDLEEKLGELQKRAKEIKIGVASTGFDANLFQRVDATLQAVGLSGEASAKSLEHVADATLKIKHGEQGADKLLEKFAALGVSLSDIQKKDYKQVWLQIAEGMRTAELTAERVTALKELLGRQAVEMIPAFKIGFDTKAANVGLVTDDELKNLEQINRVAKEGKSFWKDLGDAASMGLSKIKTGLMYAPKFFGSDVWSTKATESDGAFRGKSEGLAARKQEKVAAELAAFEQKEINEKKQKDAEKIRKEMERRSEQLREELGQDRFSLLTNEEKLRVLKAQSDVLKEQRGSLEAGKRINGESAEGDAAILENQVARAKNAKQQKEIQDAITRQEKPKDIKFNATQNQENGARIAFNPMQSAIKENTRAIIEHTDLLRKVRPEKTNPDGVNYG